MAVRTRGRDKFPAICRTVIDRTVLNVVSSFDDERRQAARDVWVPSGRRNLLGRRSAGVGATQGAKPRNAEVFSQVVDQVSLRKSPSIVPGLSFAPAPADQILDHFSSDTRVPGFRFEDFAPTPATPPARRTLALHPFVRREVRSAGPAADLRRMNAEIPEDP